MTCRRWNWRQGTRTRLTGATTRAFFLLDRLEPFAVEELDAAVADLRAGLGAATVVEGRLTPETPALELVAA